MSNEWPFADAKAEFAALLGKMTASQRAGMRERIEGGKISGHSYAFLFTECGCIYGTYLMVTEQEELLDKLGIEIEVGDFFWGAEPDTILTPLERKVWNVEIGQTPADSPVLADLIAQMDAYEKEIAK